MALDDLLSAMRARADEEIAELEREARNQEDEILAEAEREASALEERLADEAKRELRVALARRRSQGRGTARAIVSRAREEAFVDLVDGARGELARLRDDGDGYRGRLAALLDEALEVLPDAGVLVVDPRDESLARELASESSADLRVRPDLVALGGLVLDDGDGRLVHNTLETRLAAAEPALRLRFARLLDELDLDLGEGDSGGLP